MRTFLFFVHQKLQYYQYDPSINLMRLLTPTRSTHTRARVLAASRRELSSVSVYRQKIEDDTHSVGDRVKILTSFEERPPS